MMKKRMGKKGQLTVFIILGLAIVFVVVLLLVNRGGIDIKISSSSPVEQLRECMKDSLIEGKELVSKQGGNINPENYFLYRGEKLDYLCYSSEYYEGCVMQKPLLRRSVEKELEGFIEPRVNNCLNSMKTELENSGFEVKHNTPEFRVKLLPSGIIGEIELGLEISKNDIERFEIIQTNLNSEMYNLVMIASSIINYEARYGDSESTFYMRYYPSLRVEKLKQSDGTTIYILTNKVTREVFKFASRSYAIPPGLIRPN